MKRVAYTNAVIVDGTPNMEPYEGTLVVEGDKIAHIYKGGASAEDLAGYERLDMRGAFVAPGLINMHVHLAGNGKPQKKQRDNAALVSKIMGNPASRAVFYKIVCQYAEIELMSGVTTIRTVGGLGDFDTRCRDEIKAGKIRGPRIISSNQGISVPGGHMAGSVAVAAHSDEEAVALVNMNAAQGVDFIKLMITGGVMDAKVKGMPGELKMPPSMVKAACDRAHELGYIVAAHVESTEGMKVALENGVDSIEHGAAPTEETTRLFKEKSAFLTTTLSPALPYALFDESVSHASEAERYNGNVVFQGIIDCCKNALANGIPVALGNDVGCPWVSQYDFWRELVYLQTFVGVDCSTALNIATLNNAQLAGIGDITGSLEVGKSADFIALESNPLDDLLVLQHPHMVCARGQFIPTPKVKRRAIVDQELAKFMLPS